MAAVGKQHANKNRSPGTITLPRVQLQDAVAVVEGAREQVRLVIQHGFQWHKAWTERTWAADHVRVKDSLGQQRMTQGYVSNTKSWSRFTINACKT